MVWHMAVGLAQATTTWHMAVVVAQQRHKPARLWLAPVQLLALGLANLCLRLRLSLLLVRARATP